MDRGIRALLKRTVVYDLVAHWRGRGAYERWVASGRTTPVPPAAKQRIVLDFAQRFGARVLVETGTYMGAMIAATQNAFAEIHSIELDPYLHRRARRRFRRLPHVHLYEGDSARVLPRVLESLDEPALFWLDAHFSEGITARGDSDTPIAAELEAVLTHRHAARHVVLVDDARDFDGAGSYPTIESLRTHVGRLRPELAVEVEHDIVRLYPAARAGI